MGVFKMLIDVGVNAAGVRVGLNQIQNTIGSWANGAAGSIKGKLAATFGAAAILEASRRAIEYADNLDALADRLGVSTTALQEFGYAAKVNNAQMDDFVSAIEKFNAARSEILSGSDRGKDLLKSGGKFGLGLNEFKNMRADDALKQVGRTFKNGGDPQALIGPLRDLFGRGSGNLIPSFVDGLDDAATSAKRLGIIVDGTTIKSLATLADEFEIVKMELRAGFIPALRYAIEGMMRYYYMARGSGSTLGNASAFMGALAGGASIKEANEIRKQVTGEADTFVDRMIAEIEGKSKSREELLEKLRKMQFPEGGAEESKSREGRQGQQLGGPFAIRTENQRVGAFVNPIAFAVEKEQVQVLKRIEKNTRQSPKTWDDNIYPE